MNPRIVEINTRLAAIAAELESATGDALTALENEANALIAERAQLEGDTNRRQQLRGRVAAGTVGTIVEPAGDPEPAQRSYAIDSPEYRTAFLMRLQGRELNAEQRAAVTASGAIPTQTMNSIVAYLDESPILSLIDLTYIPSNVSWPVEKTTTAAQWVAMGTAATDGSDAVDTISLMAYKLIKTVEITADVQNMAIDAFEKWLINSLAVKVENALGAAVFSGTGNNQATGICTTIKDSTGTFTKAKATYADIIKILAALPARYAKNATFAMPRALFFTDVIGIEDANKQPICHPDLESPAKYNILGYRVTLDENAPADTILFGDFKAYKMNISNGPDVTADDSVAFRTGSRVYRAMALADGKLADSAAFVKYTRATS